MNELDQRRAPFFDALEKFRHTDSMPFSTPGHKRGRGAPEAIRNMMGSALACDIPHAGGVDTTHVSKGILQQAEKLAASAHGADDARFLVNGSTTGNLALLLATCSDGDEVIISRMLHKSLLAGLVFSGARPIYLTPEIETRHNLPLDVGPDAVSEAIRAHPNTRAVVLVSPSYVGVTSNLQAIAGVCHGAGIPLLIDEAWGPHFYFHPDLPDSAMQSGADASVSSTHKMLSALTQGSTLVVRQGRLDLERLHTTIDMVQTTSPSALIFASLDAARRQMALHGERLLGHTLDLAHQLRAALKEIEGLAVLDRDIVAGRPGADLDPTRVIVDVHGLGLTGYDAERMLRDEYDVYVEMSDLLSVMLLITIGDDESSIKRAIGAFRSIAEHRQQSRHTVTARSSGVLLFHGDADLTPREAFMAQPEIVAVNDAVGRISVDSITPYPPGIPAVAPGERLTREIVEYLRTGIVEGMYISGLSDPTFRTVRVVK